MPLRLVSIALAPVALHNRAGGANHQITPVGPRLVYHGNNLDFHKSGQRISKALAFNQLSFRLLMLLYIAGLKMLRHACL